VREGTKLVDHAGHGLGHVTSGTTSPTLNQPVSMAYLPVNRAVPGGTVYAVVREKKLPMRISAMPFVPHRYHRS